MRALFLCLAVPLLGGCSSLIRQGGDSFEASGVPAQQFESDDGDCRLQADTYLAYDVRGMEGTRYRPNRLFNSLYDHCMIARGYRPRPYIENLLPD